MNDINWFYPDPPQTKVLTVGSVLKGEPILLVEHKESGDWHFCDAERVFTRDDLVMVPLERILELDPSVQELAELPAGWRAWRESKEDAWECESSKTKDRRRDRVAKLLEEMERTRITLPPGLPSIVEMLREDRNR